MSESKEEDISNSPQAVLVKNSEISSDPPVLPIHANNIHLNEMDQLIQNSIKVEVYNRARVVRILSLIDMAFLVINLIISFVTSDVSWFFFLFFPLCLCGYLGAKNYNKYFVMAYSSYLLIMSIIYLTIVFAYQSFLYLILFFIQTYFLFYSIQFTRYLTKINDDTIYSLRDGWKPEDREIVIYYY